MHSQRLPQKAAATYALIIGRRPTKRVHVAVGQRATNSLAQLLHFGAESISLFFGLRLVFSPLNDAQTASMVTIATKAGCHQRITPPSPS